MRALPERIGAAFSWLVSGALIAAVTALVGYLVVRGAKTLGPGLFFGEADWLEAVTGRAFVFDGIWPALAGTLLLVLISSLIAIPVGVSAGIFLSEYAGPRWRRAIGFCADLLAGVPSIVMGLFGFTLILFLRRTFVPGANTCLLLASFCLALLVLPYLIRTTSNALSGLPEDVRLVGHSLGLNRLQNTIWILLPSAGRGILSGIVLAIGRAAEDAAVIMLTGAVMSAGLPGDLTAPFEALPFRIYYVSSEYRNVVELDRAFGCALVLLMMTAGLFLIAFRLRSSLERRWRS